MVISSRRVASLLLSLLGLLVVTGCPHPKVTAAPPPLRPKEVVDNTPPPPTGPDDCDVPTASDELAALTYNQRSIVESENLARDGVNKLGSASAPGIDEPTKDSLLKDAVDTLIQSLQADPYNVNATYNLAAAYARIDRKQCSINLLQRLIQMRGHPSKKTAVEEKLDRLLGRKKTPMDPDFKTMRSDGRFRDLIQSICAGSNDPDCHP